MRAELVDWLEAYEPHTFFTVTFGKKWPVGPTPVAVQYHLDAFLGSFGDPLRFCVAERGNSGQRRWHGHGLLLRGAVPCTEDHRRKLWGEWGRRYGRSQFAPVDVVGGAAGYVAKYCTQYRYEDRWWIAGRD